MSSILESFRSPLLVVGIFMSCVMEVSSQAPLCTANRRAIEWFGQGEAYRNRGQNMEAVQLFQQAIDKEPGFCEAWFRLALSYRAMRQPEKALAALRSGIGTTADPVKLKAFHFELGEILARAGRYQEALPHLDKFLELEKVNLTRINAVRRLKANCEFAFANMTSTKVYPRMLSETLNCFHTQYFPVLTADERQIFYTRRNGKRPEDTEDIFWSEKDDQGMWKQPVSVSNVINTPNNEGTCSVSGDGRQMIFTSCSGRENYGSCDLYESRKTGNRWSVPENLGPAVNSRAWESQPSLSADGRVLYFISDRKGGYGARDIYQSRRNERGEWSPARNLGPVINSADDEISPFIHANGVTLYFSSNGHAGFGGYDIFRSVGSDSVWEKPVNFGYPVNNFHDQFAMSITPDGLNAYYAFEDPNDGENSKLMTIEIPLELRMTATSASVSGKVTDSKTGRPLGARVELVDLKSGEKVSVVQSDSVNGSYLIVLTRGADYGLFVTRPGYLYKSIHFDVQREEIKPVLLDVPLDPIIAGSVVVLSNIFFDFDRFNLRSESIPELGKVHRFLLENPTTRIEVSGHTDNIGSDATNRTLSLNRARAVTDYLIAQGIDPKRLVAVGLAATRPRATNETDQGRALNRRIEFRILGKN